MSKTDIASFQKRVLNYYKTHGRHSLPWRKTHDPYKILVSEIMLQQTQVDRCISKYREFLTAFPTVTVLASASLQDVLRVWSGLGYNRRGKMLHDAAKSIITNHKGQLPKTIRRLESLPGVGPYTAAAVMAFAYNEPVLMIETNIRSVFLHEFFRKHEQVSDSEIVPFLEHSLDRKNAREWYAALMDYGSFLKKEHPNPSRKSTHHVKQSRFEGSLRQVRGAILRRLTQGSVQQQKLISELDFLPEKVNQALNALTKEGIVTISRNRIRIT